MEIDVQANYIKNHFTHTQKKIKTDVGQHQTDFWEQLQLGFMYTGYQPFNTLLYLLRI